MPDLTMTLKYDDTKPKVQRGAVDTLRAATNCLKLLQALDRTHNKTATAQVLWDVNIYSLGDRAVIEFTAIGDRKAGRWVQEVLQARGLSETEMAAIVEERAE